MAREVSLGLDSLNHFRPFGNLEVEVRVRNLLVNHHVQQLNFRYTAEWI